MVRSLLENWLLGGREGLQRWRDNGGCVGGGERTERLVIVWSLDGESLRSMFSSSSSCLLVIPSLIVAAQTPLFVSSIIRLEEKTWFIPTVGATQGNGSCSCWSPLSDAETLATLAKLNQHCLNNIKSSFLDCFRSSVCWVLGQQVCFLRFSQGVWITHRTVDVLNENWTQAGVNRQNLLLRLAAGNGQL